MKLRLSVCCGLSGVIIGVLVAGSALAQQAPTGGEGGSAGAFDRVVQVPGAVEALPRFVRTPGASVYRIDWVQLQRALDLAGRVPGGEAAPLAEWPIIALPHPGSGAPRLYRIVESSIMEPGLAVRYPQFKTYLVRGIGAAAERESVGRLDVTTQGLRAMIRTGAGTVFIDPYSGGEREHVSVYFLHNFVSSTAAAAEWSCHTGPQHGAGEVHAAPHEGEHGDEPLETPAGVGGLPLRVYRMAMACSGEYGAYQGTVQGNTPNTADALAAIVTVVNRCNLTFEVDLGVRFVMVANSHLLAFFDPATDPYPDADPTCTSNPAADCSGPYLNTNVTALNNIIGSANYDIGHVLTRVRGGVAYLRAACGGNKGGGVSGIPRGGEVEPVSALVPLHELGHQYGANHTFNGVLGRCNANINGTTNWEPGGGSTLMAYPGACPVGGPIGGDGSAETDNLVLFADPYFHTGSLIEMRNFLGGTQSQCSTNVLTTNFAAPVITGIPGNSVIPPSTPLALTASAVDDGATLTYCWEELDVGPAQRLTGPTAADNGTSALFRSWPPVADPTRVIPRLPDLLAGIPYIGERMPTVAGAVRKFRVTVRDNQGRSTSSNRVDLTIGAVDPFVVSEPVAAQRVPVDAITVRWNHAQIAAAPIGVSTVNISLSLDGGQTFPHVLATAAPNTGQAVFSVLGSSAAAGTNGQATARIKVAANGNVFFNIAPFGAGNAAGFVLVPPCAADFNHDGTLNPDDLGDYINCYFSPAACSGADINGDGDTNPDDLGDYINLYFAGCQ